VRIKGLIKAEIDSQGIFPKRGSQPPQPVSPGEEVRPPKVKPRNKRFRQERKSSPPTSRFTKRGGWAPPQAVSPGEEVGPPHKRFRQERRLGPPHKPFHQEKRSGPPKRFRQERKSSAPKRFPQERKSSAAPPSHFTKRGSRAQRHQAVLPGKERHLEHCSGIWSYIYIMIIVGFREAVAIELQ